MHEIKLIRVKELIGFIHSQDYSDAPVVPISIPRALSYTNNIRAHGDDIVIVLLYDGKQMIAYRCLYPDHLFYRGETIRFSWISGSWVHPNHRRLGLSMKILKHIVHDLRIPLLFSNYAQHSKALYDKSNDFTRVALLEGKRYYFRFAFFEVLPPRKTLYTKLKGLLYVLDHFLNSGFNIRFLFIKTNRYQGRCFETSRHLRFCQFRECSESVQKKHR
jgi:hypothetical protein